MPRATLQQKLIAGLQACGATESSATRQVRGKVFTFPIGHARAGDYYYVGKNGALRKGRTKGESISLTESKLWRELVALGEHKLQEAAAQRPVR
jgi:hypothetical protein